MTLQTIFMERKDCHNILIYKKAGYSCIYCMISFWKYKGRWLVQFYHIFRFVYPQPQSKYWNFTMKIPHVTLLWQDLPPSCHPSDAPWEPLLCFTFQKRYLNGIIQYVTFLDRYFFSLSIIPWRFSQMLCISTVPSFYCSVVFHVIGVPWFV